MVPPHQQRVRVTSVRGGDPGTEWSSRTGGPVTTMEEGIHKTSGPWEAAPSTPSFPAFITRETLHRRGAVVPVG